MSIVTSETDAEFQTFRKISDFIIKIFFLSVFHKIFSKFLIIHWYRNAYHITCISFSWLRLCLSKYSFVRILLRSIQVSYMKMK